MTGEDLKKAVDAVGNGGVWGAAYRLSVWVFSTMMALLAFFAYDKLDTIDQKIEYIQENKILIKRLETKLEGLEKNSQDRYTGTQARHDWATQNRVDSQQDRDRERLERRIEAVSR